MCDLGTWAAAGLLTSDFEQHTAVDSFQSLDFSQILAPDASNDVDICMFARQNGATIGQIRSDGPMVTTELRSPGQNGEGES